MAFVSIAIMLGSYQFMAFMSKSKYSGSGNLVDSGNDLNMEGGIAEYVYIIKFILLKHFVRPFLMNNWYFSGM